MTAPKSAAPEKPKKTRARIQNRRPGAIAATFVCPLNVIKTRLQVHGLPERTQSGIRGSLVISSLERIIKNEGFRGMYKGLSPTVLALLPNWALDSTEQVQLRIQKFLGKIGGQNHLLVPDKDLLQMIGVGGLSWDTTNQVKFALPFKDIKPDIWLDTLLLRIVEISTSSSDRSVKVAASEQLHVVAIVMAGSAAKGPMRRRGEERDIMKM